MYVHGLQGTDGLFTALKSVVGLGPKKLAVPKVLQPIALPTIKPVTVAAPLKPISVTLRTAKPAFNVKMPAASRPSAPMISSTVARVTTIEPPARIAVSLPTTPIMQAGHGLPTVSSPAMVTPSGGPIIGPPTAVAAPKASSNIFENAIAALSTIGSGVLAFKQQSDATKVALAQARAQETNPFAALAQQNPAAAQAALTSLASQTPYTFTNQPLGVPEQTASGGYQVTLPNGQTVATDASGVPLQGAAGEGLPSWLPIAGLGLLGLLLLKGGGQSQSEPQPQRRRR